MQAATAFTGGDVRFTSKGDVVYAYLMAWPSGGAARLQSLADGAVVVKGEVKLMCSGTTLQWRQTVEALEVREERSLGTTFFK